MAEIALHESPFWQAFHADKHRCDASRQLSFTDQPAVLHSDLDFLACLFVHWDEVPDFTAIWLAHGAGQFVGVHKLSSLPHLARADRLPDPRQRSRPHCRLVELLRHEPISFVTFTTGSFRQRHCRPQSMYRSCNSRPLTAAH